MSYPSTGLIALLAILAAACGKVTSLDDLDGGDNGGDGGIAADAAPPPDATPPPDARTHGTVTVTLLTSDGPLADTAVMYHEPDGSYLGSVLTDVSGTAMIEDMPIGGLVTAPVTTLQVNADYSLTTVVDVQHGDHIVLGRPPSPEPSSLRVTLPGEYGNATSYRADTGCSIATFSDPTTAQSMTVSAVCEDANGRFDVAAYASSSASSADRLAYSVATGALNAVTLPAWSTNLGTHTVTLTGVPDEHNANVLAKGARGDALIDPAPSRSTSEGVTQSFRMASGFYDDVVVTASISRQEAVDVRGVNLRGITPPAGGATTATSVNMATDVFPAASPTLEMGTTLALSLSPERALTCRDEIGPDVLLASFIGATGEETTYQWTILQRGDRAGDGVALPTLEPAIAAVRWPRAEFVEHQVWMYLIGSSGTDWDGYRTDVLAMIASLIAQDRAITCTSLALISTDD